MRHTKNIYIERERERLYDETCNECNVFFVLVFKFKITYSVSVWMLDFMGIVN